MIGSLSTRERVQTRVHKPQTRVTSVYVDAALVGSGARAGRIISYTYSSRTAVDVFTMAATNAMSRGNRTQNNLKRKYQDDDSNDEDKGEISLFIYFIYLFKYIHRPKV